MTLQLRNLALADSSPKFEQHRSATAPLHYNGLPKRLFDICVVLLSLPVVLPLVGVLMLLAMLDGHSPLYRQRRIGLGGRVFDMLKIRTMVPDADARLEEYLAANPAVRAEWESLQKLHKDPRVTLIGRLLRKSSLDELPQLWNVLKGDMSLVGPRPMMVHQRPLYPGQVYFALRPGVTGLWQISDRNSSTFADRSVFDDAYAANLSFSNDFRILCQTVAVVLRGTGC